MLNVWSIADINDYFDYVNPKKKEETALHPEDLAVNGVL